MLSTLLRYIVYKYIFGSTNNRQMTTEGLSSFWYRKVSRKNYIGDHNTTGSHVSLYLDLGSSCPAVTKRNKRTWQSSNALMVPTHRWSRHYWNSLVGSLAKIIIKNLCLLFICRTGIQHGTT